MDDFDVLSPSEQLKISCFSSGIALSPRVISRLTDGGKKSISLHEYATTGGVTLIVKGDIYINAPFDDWFAGRAEAALDLDEIGFHVNFRSERFEVNQVLPLPGYIDVVGAHDRVTEVVMSHGDRVRLSPIRGCVYDCKFCDLADVRAVLHPSDQLLEGLEVALSDSQLPVTHGLISGGSPGPAQSEYFEAVCLDVINASRIPFDIMMSAPKDGPRFVTRMVDAGLRGFSLNIEVASEILGLSAPDFLPRKAKFSAPRFEETLVAAVEATGGNGRVRSLLIVGLETPDQTLNGVQWLAERGCDPVLSPFRPARDTQLSSRKPPSNDELAYVLTGAREIVARWGVQLGPRCVPCQHNTLNFPTDVDDERRTRVAA